MKFILSLVFTFLFSITTYAAPVFYQYGSSNDQIVYLGQTNTYEIYATKNSLNFLDAFSTYRETKIWVLDIFYAPKTEAIRQKMLELLKQSDIGWINAASGSRKYWAIKTTMSYDPSKPFLNMDTQEDVINDYGEIIGMKNCKSEIEENEIDFNNPNSFTQIVNVVNAYLERHYPPKRKNAPAVE